MATIPARQRHSKPHCAGATKGVASVSPDRRRVSISTICCSGASRRPHRGTAMSPREGGAERVREAIDGAEEVNPEAPRPLMRDMPPADRFPVDALGDVLAPAAHAIQDRVQAPLAICGQSVLAAATLAVQAHADVELPMRQLRPLTNFYMTIAATGERKSAVDAEA